jgi:hypothetical protein
MHKGTDFSDFFFVAGRAVGVSVGMEEKQGSGKNAGVKNWKSNEPSSKVAGVDPLNGFSAVCVSVSVSVCVCVFVCTAQQRSRDHLIYLYVCMYVYTHIYTFRHMYAHTHTQPHTYVHT